MSRYEYGDRLLSLNKLLGVMTTPRTNGAYLNELWNVGAAHALYIHDGHWYHPLKRFPGALFDLNGYVLFKTQEEFSAFRHGKIEKDFALPPPGISALPDYVRVVPDGGPSSPFAPPFWDVDIHGSSVALEGRRRLVVHLERERNQTIVRKKKKNATSLNCEICAFSFERAYGSAAGEYCEVHHLLPLSDLDQISKTRIQDLAILCANCHRVIHLRNPPYSISEVRRMLRNAEPGAPPNGGPTTPFGNSVRPEGPASVS